MSRARAYTRISIAMPVVIVVSILWASVAEATGAIPIKVEAHIDSPALQRPWGQRLTEEIEIELQRAWIERLGQHFPHWDFHAGESKSYAHLLLTVSEPESRKVLIGMSSRLGTQNPQETETRWQQTWLEPADFDLGRRPSASRAKDALLDKSSALFADAEQQSIKDWLQTTIPLGLDGRWQKAPEPKDYRIVTSLAWDRFETLKFSVFRLACVSDEDRVDVESEGTRQPGAYTSASGTTYDALVVKPVKVSADKIDDIPADDIDRYQKIAIFLAQKRDPIDFDLF